MTDSSAEFDLVLADHKHLNALFTKVRLAFAADTVDQAELSALLEDLKVQILEHFAHEEREGLFERIGTLAPRLTEEAVGLKQQHQALAELLVAICEPVEQGVLGAPQMQQVATRFTEFLMQFATHEEGENRLLQEAYDRDVGSKD